MGVLSAVGLEEEVDHVDGADTEDIDARKEVDQRRAKEMTHRRDGVMTMNSRALVPGVTRVPCVTCHD